MSVSLRILSRVMGKVAGCWLGSLQAVSGRPRALGSWRVGAERWNCSLVLARAGQAHDPGQYTTPPLMLGRGGCAPPVCRAVGALPARPPAMRVRGSRASWVPPGLGGLPPLQLAKPPASSAPLRAVGVVRVVLELLPCEFRVDFVDQRPVLIPGAQAQCDCRKVPVHEDARPRLDLAHTLRGRELAFGDRLARRLASIRLPRDAPADDLLTADEGGEVLRGVGAGDTGEHDLGPQVVEDGHGHIAAVTVKHLAEVVPDGDELDVAAHPGRGDDVQLAQWRDVAGLDRGGPQHRLR